jgi:hypothetical protein
MRFVKRRSRPGARLSLILLDWSVRESFHLLQYLRQQTVPRDAFEVIVVEYYDRESPALQRFAEEVDTWLLLDMPRDCLYHKHLMYNAGIAVAGGEILMIGDSDAMVRPSFIAAILDAFAKDPRQVLHLDQFRNHRRDFYPFSYPSFEEVLGDGCINNVAGKTAGVLDTVDPIHRRNYGACMCARRADLIAIGGADEHADYLGHICGPYDMTFRLVNRGEREVWHESEFMSHTWHPGQAGEDNYQGPHDGRQLSTTSIEALVSRRVMPLVENAAIASLRRGEGLSETALLERVIDPAMVRLWQSVSHGGSAPPVASDRLVYQGHLIEHGRAGWTARPILAAQPTREARSLPALKAMIDRAAPSSLRIFTAWAAGFVLFDRLWERFVVDRRRASRTPLPSPPPQGGRGKLGALSSSPSPLEGEGGVGGGASLPARRR